MEIEGLVFFYEHILDINIFSFIFCLFFQGSGKSLTSSEHDHIFFYFSDHGAYQLLFWGEWGDKIYAEDLVAVSNII